MLAFSTRLTLIKPQIIMIIKIIMIIIMMMMITMRHDQGCEGICWHLGQWKPVILNFLRVISVHFSHKL